MIVANVVPRTPRVKRVLSECRLGTVHEIGTVQQTQVFTTANLPPSPNGQINAGRCLWVSDIRHKPCHGFQRDVKSGLPMLQKSS